MNQTQASGNNLTIRRPQPSLRISATGLAIAFGLICLPAHASDGERLVVKLKETSALTSVPTESVLLLEKNRLVSAIRKHSSALIHQRITGDGAHVVVFEQGTSSSDREKTLNALRADPAVEWVEPDRRIRTQAAGPLTGAANLLDNSNRAWFLKPVSAEPASTNAATLWQRFRGDSRAVVAVVDTGILPGHPSLAGRVLPGFDMVADAFVANDNQTLRAGSDRDADASDPGSGVSPLDALLQPECGGPSTSSWHGTFVSALIAGNPVESEQVLPVNWHGQILPIRALGRCGGFTSDLADAIRWAAGLPVPGAPLNPAPATVINLSLGANGPCSGNIEGAAINAVLARGVVVVAAAGNQGSVVDSPANCPGAIAVGASDQEGLKASYSNHGREIVLMAPGGDAAFPIWSASNSGTQAPNQNTYASKIGTSFAAPLVSATVSLMQSVNPALGPAEIVQILRQTARPFLTGTGAVACAPAVQSVSCTCNRTQCGAGMLDVAAAVNAARPGQVLANLTGPGVVPAGETGRFDARGSFNPAGGALNWRWEIVSFEGTVPPGIVSPTAALTDIRFPEGSRAARLRLTVSNGAQSHSITKNIVVAEVGSAQADVAGALLTLVTGTVTAAPVASGNTGGAGSSGTATGSENGGGQTAPSGGGGGGKTGLPGLVMLLTGLTALRRAARALRPTV